MQKIFVCTGSYNKIDVSEVNACLKIYNAKVVSITPFFEPTTSSNTIQHGNYGVIITVESDSPYF